MDVNWIKREDKSPTKDDANTDDFIWYYNDNSRDVGVMNWENFGCSAATHWAIMNFPEPPIKYCDECDGALESMYSTFGSFQGYWCPSCKAHKN